MYGFGFCHHECSPPPLIVPLGKKENNLESYTQDTLMHIESASKVRRIVGVQVGFGFVVLFLVWFIFVQVSIFLWIFFSASISII